MMPIPPTSRLTAATAPSSDVMIRVVAVSAVAISFMSRIEKSSSPLGLCRRSRSSSVRSSWHLGRRHTVARGGEDRPDVRVAGERALQPAQRHQHEVVLVLAEADSPLGSSTPIT